jgi:MFS family permease
MDSKPPPKYPAKPERFELRTIGAAIAAVTIVGIGLSLSMTLLAVRLAERGFSARAIGVNAAAGGLATLLMAPLVPALARWVGVKPLLIFALLAGAANLAALAATQAYWTWFALRGLFGAALTILFALSEFWISSAAPAGRRGVILGVYTAGFACGAAIGPALLAVIGTRGSGAFFAAAVLFLVASLPIAFVSGEAPVLARPARTSVLAFMAILPVATLAAFLYGAIETGVMGLLPVYALRSGMGAATGAILVTIFALGNGVLQMPVGWISDRIDRRSLLALIAGLGAIGALLLPATREAGFAAFAVLLFVWGGVVGSLYALGLAYLSARCRGSELASGNAAYILFYSLGMLVGPPTIGLGLDVLPAGFFVALAVMLAAYFGLVAAS